MDTVQQLEQQRERILKQLRHIRSLRRGTINEQYLSIPHKGQPEPVRRGPYYVLSRHEGGKTVSQRLTSPEQLEQARADVAAHRRFVALCQEYAQLPEQLGQLERRGGEPGQEKKRRR